jgi:hypothetical protein
MPAFLRYYMLIKVILRKSTGKSLGCKLLKTRNALINFLSAEFWWLPWFGKT